MFLQIQVWHMADITSLAISVLALAISVFTAWYTLLRIGKLKMTQPTVVYFGRDTARDPKQSGLPKVYLRALLFSTSKRGRIVESMHVRLRRNETSQNFSIWVHGDDRLVRGSGLFVGETGVSTNHHFLIPKDGSDFDFSEGKYTLEVYVKLLGDREAELLFSQVFEIDRETATELRTKSAGVYFDWGPDASTYARHVESRTPTRTPEEILSMLGRE